MLVLVQAWRTLSGRALSRSQACRAADPSQRWGSPPCGGLCPAAGSSLPRSPPTHPCHCHVRFGICNYGIFPRTSSFLFISITFMLRVFMNDGLYPHLHSGLVLARQLA